MSNFKEITPEEYKGNVFNDIGKKWMLITAAKDGKVNTMTASWGNMGVMWGKDIVSVFIRQTRFTKEFVDNADCFSISFLDHEKYAPLYGSAVNVMEFFVVRTHQITIFIYAEIHCSNSFPRKSFNALDSSCAHSSIILFLKGG